MKNKKILLSLLVSFMTFVIILNVAEANDRYLKTHKEWFSSSTCSGSPNAIIKTCVTTSGTEVTCQLVDTEHSTYWQTDRYTDCGSAGCNHDTKQCNPPPPSCTNDCSTSGATQCSGNGYQTCGNYDSDSCLEWSSVTSCGTSSYCSGGACSSCSSGYRNCNQNSADGCEINTNTDENNCGSCGNACSTGQTCSNGVCVSPTDTTPPTVSTFSPISRTASTSDISVTVQYTDSQSSVSYTRHCWIRDDIEPPDSGTSCEPGTSNNNTFTNGGTITQTGSGVWYLCTKAKSSGGWSSRTCHGSYTKTAGFDFSMSVSPTLGTVTRGNAVSTTATATLTSGSTQSVSFSTSGAPSGVSVIIDPSTSCSPTCSRTITFSASSTATLGTSTITITGTGGGLTRSATYSLTVLTDTTPPNTTIDSGPSGTVTSTSATFTFSSTETGSTFQCKLDTSSFSACSSPKDYTGLSSGSHTFKVKATDTAGNTDTTPASRMWTIAAVCSASSGLSCQPSGSDGIDASWSSVSGATNYRLEWCPSGTSFGSSTCGYTTTPNTNALALGLTGGTTYNLRVRVDSATTCSAPSGWSTTASCTTLAQQCTGSLSLSLDKKTVEGGESMRATASGLSDCSGRQIQFDPGAGTIYTCTSGNSGCSVTFNAPSNPSTNLLTDFVDATLDRDGDGSFTDATSNDHDDAVYYLISNQCTTTPPSNAIQLSNGCRLDVIAKGDDTKESVDSQYAGRRGIYLKSATLKTGTYIEAHYDDKVNDCNGDLKFRNNHIGDGPSLRMVAQRLDVRGCGSACPMSYGYELTTNNCEIFDVSGQNLGSSVQDLRDKSVLEFEKSYFVGECIENDQPNLISSECPAERPMCNTETKMCESKCKDTCETARTLGDGDLVSGDSESSATCYMGSQGKSNEWFKISTSFAGTLTTSASPTASFDIELDKGPSCSSLVLIQENADTITTNANIGDQYWIKVTRTSSEGTATPSASLTPPTTTLQPPTLVSPSDATLVNTLTPTLTWNRNTNNPSDANYYQWYARTSGESIASAALAGRGGTTSSTSSQVSVTIPSGKLTYGTIYYWSVAQGTSATGPWSAYVSPQRSFTPAECTSNDRTDETSSSCFNKPGYPNQYLRCSAPPQVTVNPTYTCVEAPCSQNSECDTEYCCDRSSQLPSNLRGTGQCVPTPTNPSRIIHPYLCVPG